MTRVSMVICAQEGRDRFLFTALASALGQDHDDVEVMLAGDTASPRLLAVAESRPDVLLVDAAGQSEAAAFNRGALASSGDLLMFLGAEDLQHLRRAHTFARAYEVDGRRADFWGYSGVHFIGEEGAPVDPAELGLGVLGLNAANAVLKPRIVDGLLQANLVLRAGNIVVTRSLLEEVGGFDPDRYVTADWALAQALAVHRDPIVVPEALFQYRLYEPDVPQPTRDQIAAEVTSLAPEIAALRLDRVTRLGVLAAGLPGADHLRRRRPMLSAATM